MSHVDSSRRTPPVGTDHSDGARAGPDNGLAFLGRIETFRHPTGKLRILASAVAVASLGALVVYSAQTFPSTSGIRWKLLIAVGLLGPVSTIWVNAKEFQLQGRVLGQDIGNYPAIRVSVLGTTANLLPVPGALMVRTRALAAESGVKRSAGVGASTGMIWLAVSLGLTGIGLSTFGRGSLGAATLLLAAILLGAALAAGRALGADRRTLGLLLITESVLAATGAARLYFILIALSVDVNASQAVSLTASSALAGAAGIFPAGLGIREALAGLLASVVDLPASVGVAAAAIDRFAGLVTLLGALAVVLCLDALAARRERT